MAKHIGSLFIDHDFLDEAEEIVVSFPDRHQENEDGNFTRAEVILTDLELFADSDEEGDEPTWIAEKDEK